MLVGRMRVGDEWRVTLKLWATDLWSYADEKVDGGCWSHTVPVVILTFHRVTQTVILGAVLPRVLCEDVSN